MNAVEIEHVTKTFGSFTAVDDVCLVVPLGSVYGFIGPNGSGKTTTLRMIMRILHPNSGEIRVLGENRLGAANDRVGYLPEERGLYKEMKVRDILSFYAQLKGFRNNRKAVDEWLERLSLAAWADKKVGTLSKGMSQRVQFIAAVVANPELVLLDEPFSGLDPVNADVLREAILDLVRRGTTVIFSTHDMDVAERLCDAIFMIFKGRKVMDGPLETIQEEHGTDTARVRFEDPRIEVGGLEGVVGVINHGSVKELRLAPGADTQRLLVKLMERGRVLGFDVTRPSLHDLFVRIAGPEAEAVAIAASQSAGLQN